MTSTAAASLRRPWWLLLAVRSPAIAAGLLVAGAIGGLLYARTGAAAAAGLLLAVAAAAAMLRQVERAVLRLAGNRRLAAGAFDEALTRELTQLVGRLDRHDWYLERSAALNAAATGGHAVVLTSGLLTRYTQGRLSVRQVAAVVAHELGHHHSRLYRAGVACDVLELPWTYLRRAAARLMAGRLIAALVTVTAAAAAVLWLAAYPRWLVVTVVGAAAVLTLALVDAHVRRGEEFRADAYAAARGYGHDLAGVLATMPGRPRRVRVFSRYPPMSARLSALRAATPIPRNRPGRREQRPRA